MAERGNEALLVGWHCEYPSCNRVDFLPFKCGNCESMFCLDHRSVVSHNCTSDITRLRPADDFATTTSLDAFVCDFETCRRKEFNPVKCASCERNFCFSHRHPEDHQCTDVPSIQKTTTEEAASRSFSLPPTLNAPLAAPTLKKTMTLMALKVNALKLKMNAVGESQVLEANRLYLNIVLLDFSSKPVFVDSEWSFGRASESIKRALKVNLKTENARLRDPRNGNSIPSDQPIKNVVSSGGTLEFFIP